MGLPKIVVPFPTAVDPEFQVNTYTPSNQVLPVVTALADGGWLAVWMSFGQEGTDYGIYAQRYDATGNTVGAEFQVNTYTDSNQWYPSAASLSDGGWVVTWMSDLQDGSGYGIYGQRYASDGSVSGAEFNINNTDDDNQSNPYVVGLSDGGWLVVWDSMGQDGSMQGIFGQRYDAGGSAAGSEFQINSHTESEQWNPSVTALPDGGWVVVWMSANQDGSGYGVFGQRYDASGATQGTEFQVNSFTDSDQWYPAIASLADGGWVVTWMSYNQDGPGLDVYAQRYHADGTRSGSEFQVNSQTASHQGFPSITGLADGGWLISWMSVDQDSSGYGIYAQRYEADGSLLGSEFLVNTTTAYDQRYSSVAAQGDGSMFVAWESLAQDGSEAGIFAQLFTPAYADPMAGDFAEDHTLYADGSEVTDPNGMGPITWQWQRSTDNGASWQDIAGATGDSYTPDDEDVDNILRLKGTYLDGLDVTRTVYSAETTAIANRNDQPVDFVASTTGKAEEGLLLSADAAVGADDDGLPAPLTFSYQWQSSIDGSTWTYIAGATGDTYTPGADEIGSFIRVRASYIDAHGTQETVSSEATPMVVAAGTFLELTVSASSVAGEPLLPLLSMLPYDASGELFLRPTQLDPNGASYELVARPAVQSGSLEFQLDGESALLDFTLSAELAGWTIQQDSPDASTVTVSASGSQDGSNHLQAGNEVVLARFSQTENPGVTLSAASLDERTVAGRVLLDEALQPAGANDFSGLFASGASGLVDGLLDYNNSSRAIGAQDALEALRLAVGLQTTQGTADAFDYIAADFNGDGRVGAQDALEILRYAVGLSDALDARWVFVDAGADLSGISRSEVAYQNGAGWTDADADTEITLVGVLVGDVNDSFTSG